jgi:alkyldihydroxyacetonephosphate synthase
MALDRHALRWNGWGRRDVDSGLSAEKIDALVGELGRRFGRKIERTTSPVAIDHVRLAPSRLPSATIAALRATLSERDVCTDDVERIVHAAGRSLPDTLRLRRGLLTRAPDVVVYPRSADEVVAVLGFASAERIAVVPFGGGTSVVGGVEPRTGRDQNAVLALDTTRLDRLVELDARSRLATFEAGIDGPALEAALSSRGFTLGHFPQSFEFSTLGGWIAARSSGQQSDGYGGIDDLLAAVRVVTPEGEIRTSVAPRTATGPEIRQIVLGSEGVLGVIVEATLRVRPAPRHRAFRGMMFRCFEDGVAAVREIAVNRVPLTMMRLADATETHVSSLLHRDPSRALDAAALVLSAVERVGYRDRRCVLLYGAEGTDGEEVSRAMRRARSFGRANRGLPLGSRPGAAWLRGRFRGPYLRDLLLDFGVGVDTFETAFSWARLSDAHDEVVSGIERAAGEHAGAGIAMSHLSHSYETGACLYFTLAYPVDPVRDIAQWEAIKRDVTCAILAAGGTLSHHHGVGIDHRQWLEEERGGLAIAALRALKDRVDPNGIMNPGKVL